MFLHKIATRNKLKKKYLCALMTGTLILGSIGSFGMNVYATAASSTSDASVEQAEHDRDDAKKKKEAAQRELNALKDIQSGIKDKIVELDLAITELQAQITELEMDQKKIEDSIKQTKEDLKLAKEAEEAQYQMMKDRIQMVYESGNKGYLDVLLSATSMTDVMNKMEYTSQVSLYDYNLLTGLQETRGQVAAIEQKLELDLANNEKLQKDASKEKDKMEVLVEEKQDQMEVYDEAIQIQQEEVAKYQQAQAEAEAIIQAAEQAALAALGGSGDATTYVGGQFTWPVPGFYTISSYFGPRPSPTPGASSYHKGLDIPLNVGTPVVAAANGTVIVATYNYAEGNYVVVDHGGGVVSVYMHNSSLAVNVGDSVQAGTTIAYGGSTGVSTGPHCHFGVRVNGSYVDPLSYLQ